MMLDEPGMRAHMLRAQAGDQAAYRTLLEGVRAWLLRYYRYRLPPAAVEDAVQDALVAVHTKRASYDGARPFMPWLKAIARYLWIDRLRRMQRYAEGAEPGQEDAEWPHEVFDDAEDIARLLARLKPAQADVIRLVKLRGYSVDEAARLTGQSVPLVKVNVHRGVARLARLIREFG